MFPDALAHVVQVERFLMLETTKTTYMLLGKKRLFKAMIFASESSMPYSSPRNARQMFEFFAKHRIY